MDLHIITRSQVAELLPMSRAIELVRHGFELLAAGRVTMPPRQRIETAAGDLLIKPACLPGEGLCVKLALTYPGNPAMGLPVVQGLLMVFDDATGTPRALMDAGELTAIRTGAAGGLAIDLLARPESRCVALIGAGVQGRSQLLAALEVRPIEEVLVFDICPEAAVRLQQEFDDHPRSLRITTVADPDDAVARADIVITATASPVPTFHGSALRHGSHVNAVGAYQPDRREIDEEAMRRAYVVADGYQAAGIEAGELRIPGLEADAELAELVCGSKPGRTDPAQITLFKSVGMAVQDAVCACHVLTEAEKRGVGITIDLLE